MLAVVDPAWNGPIWALDLASGHRHRGRPSAGTGAVLSGTGRPVVDVAEVWALGARSDSEVYDEMRSRVSSLPKNPATEALSDIVSKLGKVGAGLEIEVPAPSTESLPPWLHQRLMDQVHLTSDQIEELSFEEALKVWEEFLSQPRQ